MPEPEKNCLTCLHEPEWFEAMHNWIGRCYKAGITVFKKPKRIWACSVWAAKQEETDEKERDDV